MRSLNLTVGTLLVAAAVATAAADEALIETIIVTAKPARTSFVEVEKVAPETTVEVVAPMPTDMPEAEIDYHMLRISVSPSAEHVKS